MYDNRRGNAYSKYHGYAYDGIWVIAQAIDSLIRQNDGVFSEDDFRSERIDGALNETNFIGVTVSVTYLLYILFTYKCLRVFFYPAMISRISINICVILVNQPQSGGRWLVK